MKYADYIDSALLCTSYAEADELIKAAGDDWKLSDRQYENIRRAANRAAYEWIEANAQ